MELMIFGINILLLMFVWKFMIRKTILDTSRDKLFDLRDELRATFVKNEWDLGSPIYKKLRDLLNGHLRFTEEFSIWEFVCFEALFGRDKKLRDESRTKIQKTFVSADPRQQEFITSIRRRAVVVVMEFTVYNSGLLLIASIVFAPVVTAAKVIAVVQRGVDASIQVCIQSARDIGNVTSIVMSRSAELIADRLFRSELFESCSYRIGTSNTPSYGMA